MKRALRLIVELTVLSFFLFSTVASESIRSPQDDRS